MAQQAAGFAKKSPATRHDRVGNAGHGGDGEERQATVLKLAQLISPYRKHGRLAFRIERMPQHARLSAGRNNGNNSWSLVTDDLDGLTYLAPAGAGAHTIALRIIGLEDGGSTLAVIELPIEAPESEAGDDAASDEYVRQLSEELQKLKEQLAARDQELERRKRDRSQPSDIKNIIDAELTSARASWKLEMDQRLVAAAKEAAAAVEAAKAGLQEEHSSRVAQSEERTQARIVEARERWRQEAKGAIVQAQATWKAEEAARVAKLEEQWRAKLKAAESKTASAVPSADNSAELKAARDQVKALQATVADRDTAMTDLRAQSDRVRTVARQELDDALRNAEANWRAGEAARLNTLEAQWRAKLAEVEARAADVPRDTGAAAELERAKRDIAQLKDQLKERETAFDNAEMARRTDEAARRASIDAEWQAKIADAEAKAVATARAGAAAEGERNRAEIAALKKDLADAEAKAAATVRAEAAAEGERNRTEIAALKKELADRETVHRNNEIGWRQAEANRSAASDVQWQAKLADATNAAKADAGTSEKLAAAEASIAALRNDVAARDKAIAELHAKQDEAEGLWKLGEASRLADAEAQWRHLSEVNLADWKARCERAEAALAETPAKPESATEAELRAAREALELTKAILKQRDGALAEAEAKAAAIAVERDQAQSDIARVKAEAVEAQFAKLQSPFEAVGAPSTEIALEIEKAKAQWRIDEAARLSEAETKWRDQIALEHIQARGRAEAAESALAQLRLRAERDRSDEALGGDPRTREQMVALQSALTARENELAYAKKLLEKNGLLPAGADLQNLARRTGGMTGQDWSVAKSGARLFIELTVAAMLALGAYVYFPRAVTLMPYEWQEHIASATETVRAVLGQPSSTAKSAAIPEVGRPVATVMKSVNLRSTASTKGAVVRTLTRGTKVVMAETMGNWTMVETADGVKGWVFGTYIAQAPDHPSTARAK